MCLLNPNWEQLSYVQWWHLTLFPKSSPFCADPSSFPYCMCPSEVSEGGLSLCSNHCKNQKHVLSCLLQRIQFLTFGPQVPWCCCFPFSLVWLNDPSITSVFTARPPISGNADCFREAETSCDFVFMFLFPDVKFEIDLPKKLVWIESDKDVDVLMTALQKSGKEVKYNGTKWRTCTRWPGAFIVLVFSVDWCLWRP